MSFNSILAAIDFSSVSEKICQSAASLARSYACRLWLIHVASPDPEFVGYEVGPKVVRNQVAKEFRHEHQQLQAFAKKLRMMGVNVEALLVQGPTVETIMTQAEKVDADLIIVGSHGHGGIHNALFGSVSHGVLQNTTQPVLMIPFTKA